MLAETGTLAMVLDVDFYVIGGSVAKAGDLLLIVFVGGLLVAALGLAAGIVRDL